MPPRNDMASYEPLTESLRLLTTLHRVAAAIFGVLSLCGLPHTVIGFLMMFTGALRPTNPAGHPGSESDAFPALFGGVFFFAGLAVVALHIAMAIALWAAAGWIDLRRNYAKLQVVEAILCVFVPIGTALGVFGLVTLAKPEARARFVP